MKDYTIAKVKANLLLNEFCVESPGELDLVGIVNAKGAVINFSPLKGHMGRVFHDGSSAVITINSKIENTGQRNFVISHELGHFLNDDLSQHRCSSKDLLSYTSKKDSENAANVFAAELLMNAKWFKTFTGRQLFDRILLEEITKYFNTSLLTQNGFTSWAAFSKYFPFQFVPNKIRVKPLSTVYDFYEDGRKYNGPEEIRSEAWFEDAHESDKPEYLVEENIYMNNYKSVLTILRLADLAN
jgi:hypothetical protein